MTRNFTTQGSYFVLAPGFPGTIGSLAIKRLRCNNGGAADRWIQIHSGVAIPADTAVPLFAPLLAPANYITEDTFDPDPRIVPAPGMVLVASSTRATLTKDVAATIDITAEVEEYELQPVGPSVAGDYTTACTHLQVWASASGPKKLLRLELSNSTGATIYAQVFSLDAIPAGTIPVAEVAVAANDYAMASFGGGLAPYRQSAAFVVSKGCTVYFSTTPGVLTAVGGNSGTIRATYK